MNKMASTRKRPRLLIGLLFMACVLQFHSISLFRILLHATTHFKIVDKHSRVLCGELQPRTIFESSNPHDLLELKSALVISPFYFPLSGCCCLGNPRIELYFLDLPIGVVEIKHENGVWWKGFLGQMSALDQSRMRTWLDSKGASKEKLMTFQSDLEQTNFRATIPSSLTNAIGYLSIRELDHHDRDDFAHRHISDEGTAAGLKSLQRLYPSKKKQIEVLLEWLGTCRRVAPEYTCVPLQFLSNYGDPAILEVLRTKALEHKAWLGASEFLNASHLDVSETVYERIKKATDKEEALAELSRYGRDGPNQ